MISPHPLPRRAPRRRSIPLAAIAALLLVLPVAAGCSKESSSEAPQASASDPVVARVNGVDIGPLIEAELGRQDPDYLKLKPRTADEYREAWEVVVRRWAETVSRARELDPELLHERVDGEWSFVETLRHLCYATDAWVNRVYLGDPDPWSSLDLPFTSMRDWYWAYDTDIRPSLDEVLALRADRQAKVRRVLAELTDERLGEETVPVEGKGWPPADRYPVAEVLGVVVNEEWHHRRYAERDLAVLERHD